MVPAGSVWVWSGGKTGRVCASDDAKASTRSKLLAINFIEIHQIILIFRCLQFFLTHIQD